MAAYFSAERVQELLAGQHQVHLHFTDLRETMCVRPYKTERGAEFAKHGFCPPPGDARPNNRPRRREGPGVGEITTRSRHYVEAFSGLIVGQQPNDHAIVITSGRKPVGGLLLAAERFGQFGRRRAAILRVLGHRLHRRVTVFEHRNSDTSGVGGEADMPREPNRRD